MVDSQALALLKRQHKAIYQSDGWREFRDVRSESWDPLIRRKAPQTLNPTAAQFLQATNSAVDIQSPDLEKDLHDRVAILLANSVKIDAISLDSHKTAKADVEDIRIYAAGSWLMQDDSRRMSREMYEQMVRYGVATRRKRWSMPEEPGDEDIQSRVKGYTNKDMNASQKALKARSDYFQSSEHQCFSDQSVSPLELAWFPLSKPEIYIQESLVPYVEARDLKNAEGKALRLKQDDNRVFWGDGQPSEEIRESEWDGKTVKLIVKAELNKATNRWKVTEWVTGGDVGDSEQLDEYECPFNHSPFFVQGSGDELVTETNPHLRYRPMLYPLIVDTQELNALVTLLVMTAVWHIQNPFYVRLDGMDAELARSIEGLADQGFGTIEGAGAERKFLFRTPEPGTGEVMAAPRLEAMPNSQLPEAFLARIQQVQANIQEHKANRFLTGDAQEAVREAPATSVLNQAEAAATPFGTYLTQGDHFIREWLTAEMDAICYWDEVGEAPSKEYPWRVRGDEPHPGAHREPGEMVTLTAEKVKRPYILVCTTKNETQAERAMNDQMADSAYLLKRITKAQWLERTGSDDPQHQLEDLWKDQMEAQTDMEFQQVLMSSYRSLFMALTGLNSELMGTSMNEGAPAQMQPQQTNASVPQQKFGVQNGTAPVVQGAQGGTNPNFGSAA